MATMQSYLYDKLLPYERAEVRQSYEYSQDHLCWHCGNHLEDLPTEAMLANKIDTNLFPYNFFDHSIHLHHDRSTGLTVGAVHALCNAVLWQFEGQ